MQRQLCHQQRRRHLPRFPIRPAGRVRELVGSCSRVHSVRLPELHAIKPSCCSTYAWQVADSLAHAPGHLPPGAAPFLAPMHAQPHCMHPLTAPTLDSHSSPRSSTVMNPCLGHVLAQRLAPQLRQVAALAAQPPELVRDGAHKGVQRQNQAEGDVLAAPLAPWGEGHVSMPVGRLSGTRCPGQRAASKAKAPSGAAAAHLLESCLMMAGVDQPLAGRGGGQPKLPSARLCFSSCRLRRSRFGSSAAFHCHCLPARPACADAWLPCSLPCSLPCLLLLPAPMAALQPSAQAAPPAVQQEVLAPRGRSVARSPVCGVSVVRWVVGDVQRPAASQAPAAAHGRRAHPPPARHQPRAHPVERLAHLLASVRLRSRPSCCRLCSACRCSAGHDTWSAYLSACSGAAAGR